MPALDDVTARDFNEDWICHYLTGISRSEAVISDTVRRKGFRLFQILKGTFAVFVVVFLLPVAATSAWWAMLDRPASWRAANWQSSGVLPPAQAPGAAIHVLAARTGGLKGALAVHSWIVIKRPGEANYERYDKVGWGMPIRRNGYPADAHWYSNRPFFVHSITGQEAERLIPQVEAAIADYPWRNNGGYRIWPGPNSNSFVAHVLREVPGIGIRLPPNATGRDYAPGFASVRLAPDRRDLHVTLGGLAGFALGARSGLEVHLLGVVAGVDFVNPALKVPALGSIGVADIW